MIVVYPDSNALEPYNRYLESSDARRVLAHLAPGLFELWISPVVEEELDRHRRQACEEGRRALRKALSDLDRAFGHRRPTSWDTFHGHLDEMEIDAGYAFSQLWTHAGVTFGPDPTIHGDTLVTRDFNERRPFTRRNGQTVGLRDTVIWLGAVNALQDDRVEKLLLVTRDKAFLDSDGALHPDLLDDLDNEGLDRSRLDLRASLGEAADWLVENSTDTTPRDRAIRRALYETDALINDLGDDLMDIRSGLALSDGAAPEFLGSEYIDIVSIGPGSTPECVYLARFHFTTLVTKSSVGIGPPDPNEVPSVPMQLWRTGRVTTRVSYNPETEEAVGLGIEGIVWTDT